MEEMARRIKMTPERAAELLKELDTSTPFYYTREKRRDPFENLKDEGE